MAFDVINTGTTANDGTGDPLRTAFTKTNTNFALAVEGATGSTPNNVPVFDGTTGKLVKDSGVSIATLTAGLNFAGLWNASTNTPTLTSSVGTEGTYYVVSVAGSTNLNGVSSWSVGESALFTAGVWVKVASSFVSNPGTSTNNAVAVFDGTTGKLLKDGTGTVTAGKFSPTATTVAGNGMYLPAGDTLAFSTAGAERLRIDSSGNVGIGNTSPTSRLRIAQSSSTAYGLYSTTPFVGLTAGNTVNMAYFAGGRISDGLRIINYRNSAGSDNGNWQTESYTIERNVDNVAPQAAVRFGEANLSIDVGGVERFRINNAGDVGIGTTSPTRRLHVSDVMRLEPRATAPGSPNKGDIYFDSSDDKLKCYDGTAWQNLF
jgi:hypothetical protein